MKHHRKRGEVPQYWWDFQWEDDKIVAVIIETTDPRVATGIVERIPYHQNAISIAEKRLKDWQEGRRTI